MKARRGSPMPFAAPHSRQTTRPRIISAPCRRVPTRGALHRPATPTPKIALREAPRPPASPAGSGWRRRGLPARNAEASRLRGDDRTTIKKQQKGTTFENTNLSAATGSLGAETYYQFPSDVCAGGAPPRDPTLGAQGGRAVVFWDFLAEWGLKLPKRSASVGTPRRCMFPAGPGWDNMPI